MSVSWNAGLSSPIIISLLPRAVRSTAMNISVCPLTYLENHAAELHQLQSDALRYAEYSFRFISAVVPGYFRDVTIEFCVRSVSPTTVMNSKKTADLIEMPFGVVGRVASGNAM